MRWLSLCLTSHKTLLRAPGPLGVYANDMDFAFVRRTVATNHPSVPGVSVASLRQAVRQQTLQRAIVKSAFALGVIGPDEYRKHLQ
jgi:hypothetical protein